MHKSLPHQRLRPLVENEAEQNILKMAKWRYENCINTVHAQIILMDFKVRSKGLFNQVISLSLKDEKWTQEQLQRTPSHRICIAR